MPPRLRKPATFVDRHSLWSEAQAKAAAQVERIIKKEKLEVVRFSFADQHGVLRGKTLATAEVAAALERGISVPSTLLLKDTSHKTAFPAFTPGGGVGIVDMQGAADILMVPDESTFRVLPWAPDTGWFLCDLRFRDGSPVLFSTRDQLHKALQKLESAGYEYVAGLEVEFHIFKIRDPHLQPADAGQPGNPPDVELLTTGYQLLTEHKYDQIDPIVDLLRKNLEPLQLPLRSFELTGLNRLAARFEPGHDAARLFLALTGGDPVASVTVSTGSRIVALTSACMTSFRQNGGS